MEVKEAIDEVYQVFYMKYGKFGNQKADDIISLLQQGEKYKAENIELKVYKKVWERLESEIVYNNEGNYKYDWSDELIGSMHRLRREEEAKQDKANEQAEN